MGGREQPALSLPSKPHHRVTKRAPSQPIRKSARLEGQRKEHVLASTNLSRHNQLSSPVSHSHHSKNSKPKREQDTAEQVFREAPNKKAGPSRTAAAAESLEKLTDGQDCSSVAHWARHKVWPPRFAEKDSNMNNPNPKKRSISSSYTQGVKEGQNPRSWSLAYEREMVQYNMVMDLFQNQTTVSDNSKQLCTDLLSAIYELPKHSLFEDDIYMAVFRGARARNEARLNRDITPLIVPSAELLHIRGVTNLEHVIEEIGAEWTQCSVIYGPRPKSDYAVGLASSAFTPDELLLLKLNHTPDYPSYVTDCLYFPFLICEVKSAARTVAEAERQAMHSGSIAARAIIRLYERVSRAKELNREILVLSISHDPSVVRMHGHYALIEDEKTTFFRHLIYSFDFTLFEGRDRWTAYHFTRKVYDYFYREHLQRIRSALSQLGRRPSTSEPNTDGDAEGPDSQNLMAGAPSSQDIPEFKIPSLPPSVRVQIENDRLRDQVDMLLRQQQEQQRQQQEQQQEQQRQQQEQQRQQQEQQRQQQEQQRQQQEQISKLQDLLMEQKDQNKQQMEQYKNIMQILEQRNPGEQQDGQKQR